MAKPTFLLTKGERNAAKGHETDELIERYVRIYCSRFEWTGLPEGCPPDFLERQLFFCGGVSAKEVRGLGICVMGAAPSTLTIYATPARWLPVGIVGSMNTTSTSASLWKESDTPVLWDGEPMADRIAPYLEIQRKALNALGCNLVGLTNPVMIECVPGSELNGKIIKNNLGAGDVFIPVIDRSTLNANVLDLKATDHTQNLIGVIHDTDNTMLDMMFVRSSMEKASGISMEEATASDEQNTIGMSLELRKRKEWCERINAALGTSFDVKEAYDAPNGPVSSTDGGPEETADGDETGDNSAE
jgi:hypothetical protein